MLKHYERLADRWFSTAIDWQASWFIYRPDDERELERLARCIGLCYLGCAEGRRSRYNTLDQLKSAYATALELYEYAIEDMRHNGDICAACNELIVPPWELPPGESPCAC